MILLVSLYNASIHIVDHLRSVGYHTRCKSKRLLSSIENNMKDQPRQVQHYETNQNNNNNNNNDENEDDELEQLHEDKSYKQPTALSQNPEKEKILTLLVK